MTDLFRSGGSRLPRLRADAPAGTLSVVAALASKD
jgi:hypothetical protein